MLAAISKVIDGDDPGGITQAVNWQEGGGFRYYRLAPSLLQKDQWGNWIINQAYNPEMLAEAVCKLEGFTYAPSTSAWWNHGYSTESDLIFVTTQHLGHEQLAAISKAVGGDRSLLIMCGAFRGSADAFPNLTLKKLPKVILNRCEWGHDDYSLNVNNLPQAAVQPALPQQSDLFDGG